MNLLFIEEQCLHVAVILVHFNSETHRKRIFIFKNF